jgi:hypothetical protein
MSQFPSTTALNKIVSRSCVEDFLQVGSAGTAPQPGQNNPVINSWIDPNGVFSGKFSNPNLGTVYSASVIGATGNVGSTVFIPAQPEDATYVVYEQIIVTVASLVETLFVSPQLNFTDPDAGASLALLVPLNAYNAPIGLLSNQSVVITVAAGTEVSYQVVYPGTAVYNFYVAAVRLGSPSVSSTNPSDEPSNTWVQTDTSQDFLQINGSGSGETIAWIDSCGTPSGTLASTLPSVLIKNVFNLTGSLSPTQIVPAQSGATLWLVVLACSGEYFFGGANQLEVVDANMSLPPFRLGESTSTGCFLVPLPANDALNFETIIQEGVGEYNIYGVAQRLA